jgi:hypothetical protein
MLHFLPSIQPEPTREIEGPVLRRRAPLTAAFARRRSVTGGFLLCVAVFLGAPAVCLAQDDYHSCSLNAGGGWAPLLGTERNSLKAGWNFQAGGGFAVTPRPAPGHKWSLFMNVNFMFDKLGVQQAALQQARILNPTSVGLLEANSGKAKFYSTTLDPTIRFPVPGRVSVYVFGGFGWFRRNLEFTGASGQGALLQPGSPVVFGNGGNSGAYDAGAGINLKPLRKPRGLMFYVEARLLHGLAINNATTLVPISAGIRW